MAEAAHMQHQMGSTAVLSVQYWVAELSAPRMHRVFMVGSCSSFAHPDEVEALVLSETGALMSITRYMRRIEAVRFQIVAVSRPPEKNGR